MTGIILDILYNLLKFHSMSVGESIIIPISQIRSHSR